MSKKKNRQNDNIKEEELKTSVENTEEKTDTPEGETTDTESTDSKIAELEAKLAELMSLTTTANVPSKKRRN